MYACASLACMWILSNNFLLAENIFPCLKSKCEISGRSIEYLKLKLENLTDNRTCVYVISQAFFVCISTLGTKTRI